MQQMEASLSMSRNWHQCAEELVLLLLSGATWDKGVNRETPRELGVL